MMRIRQIQPSDYATYQGLAFSAGLGITTLPQNPELLQGKFQHSIESFEKNVTSPKNELYLFLLEDLSTQQIGGVCGIYSKTGVTEPCPYFHFKMEENIPLINKILLNNGPSEICSLFLRPEFRRSGTGRLLSLSRFLFIATHRQKFEKTIIAEMRGVIDINRHSPFWDGVGRHFIPIEFSSLMKMRENNEMEIFQKMPKHPIYLSLLPDPVQNAFGKVHEHTKPALHMLMQEGFEKSVYMDLFDGGPRIEASLDHLRVVAESSLGDVEKIQKLPLSTDFLIANTQLPYRACLGSIASEGSGLSISKEVAEALEVNLGDSIRYVSLHPKEKIS